MNNDRFYGGLFLLKNFSKNLKIFNSKFNVGCYNDFAKHKFAPLLVFLRITLLRGGALSSADASGKVRIALLSR